MDSTVLYAQALRALTTRLREAAPRIMHPARARLLLLEDWALMRESTVWAKELPALGPLLLTLPTGVPEVSIDEVADWMNRHLADLEGAS
jgi:hypothetical protein